MRDRLTQTLGWGLVGLALIYSSTARAQSPGFDCAKAAQPIERLICAHPELSALDAEMASAFKTAIDARTGDDRSLFLADQRRWLRGRVDTCNLRRAPQSNGEEGAAAECLRTSYRERVAAIAEWRPPQAMTELGEPRSLAVLARIQTALNHVAARKPYDRVAIGDPLAVVIDAFGAFLAGDGPRFQTALAAVVVEAKNRAAKFDQKSPKWDRSDVSGQVERLIKIAPDGEQPTALGILVALRLADTVLWAETKDEGRFFREAWLRMPCRTIVGRKDAIEQAARELVKVNPQKESFRAEDGTRPREVIGCPSVGYPAPEFGAVEQFASDPGGNAPRIADKAKRPSENIEPREAKGPHTLTEAKEAFSRERSLKNREDLVMFLHALTPASPGREKAIRQHLGAILKDVKVEHDISILDLDQAVFDVLDIVVAHDTLSIPCPVIVRDPRYARFLFPDRGVAAMRADDRCGEGEPEGYPDREVRAFHLAGLRTHYDWQMTTGTNGNLLLSDLDAKVSALRFPRKEAVSESDTLRPYETWSYLTLGNRAVYLPINQAYDAALAKLTAYYKRYSAPTKDAKGLAQRNLLDATLGGECGHAAPRPSIRKLVAEQAPLATITQFLSSPAARDASAADPYRACARAADGGPFDPMAHMAVYDPKVFAQLLEFASRLPPDQQKTLDVEMGVDLRNAIGKTPLMTAAQFDFVDTARMLLSRGAQVNATTKGEPLREGFRTPLMYAAQSGSLEMIRVLLAAGADRWQADGFGKTALDYLVGTGPTEPNSRLSPEEMGEAARLLY